jgi:uncharacterized Tic20 family protein
MDKITETSLLTNDERMMAMLSHLSVLIGGIILPIVIWAVQKDKSKFVKFHSLQAIFFHISLAVIIIIFVLLVVMLMVVSGLGLGIFQASSHHGGGGPFAVFIIVFVVALYGGIFAFAFGCIGYGIYLAVKSYHGAMVKIPIIGKIIYRKVYGGNSD